MCLTRLPAGHKEREKKIKKSRMSPINHVKFDLLYYYFSRQHFNRIPSHLFLSIPKPDTFLCDLERDLSENGRPDVVREDDLLNGQTY